MMQDKDFLEEETGAAGQPEDDGYYDPEEDPANADKVPVFVINGFLEAGKTQFLKFTMNLSNLEVIVFLRLNIIMKMIGNRSKE